MASDGGQLRKLAEDEVDANIPSWSRDGKWINYASNRTGRYEVWRREAQGGKAIQLTHNGGWVAFESHDGQSLYYTKPGNDPGLWVLPLEGGEEKQVLKSVGFEEFEVMDDGIYYIPGAQGETSVRFHSFATAQDKEIASIEDPCSPQEHCPPLLTDPVTVRNMSRRGFRRSAPPKLMPPPFPANTRGEARREPACSGSRARQEGDGGPCSLAGRDTWAPVCPGQGSCAASRD